MTPHKQLRDLDQKGTTYTLARLDVPSGNELMAFVEYAVVSHDADWVELKPQCMKVKTGPRNGRVLTAEYLDPVNVSNPIWFRWEQLGPFEIRQQ